jgi:hypothetical protein
MGGRGEFFFACSWTKRPSLGSIADNGGFDPPRLRKKEKTLLLLKHEFMQGLSQAILIARAANMATITSEIEPCAIISSFARFDITIVSVGLKAVLVLNAKNK